MVIVVTGEIGIGKTTVCRKLVELLRNQGHDCGGILTYKAPDQGIIIEDIESGAVETLASVTNVYDGPRTGKYFFNRQGIEFGVAAINRGAAASVLIVDEIGYLELRGEGFANILGLLKKGKVKDCVLVIRRELLPDFLPQLPAQPLVCEATTNSRNRLPREIGSALFNSGK